MMKEVPVEVIKKVPVYVKEDVGGNVQQGAVFRGEMQTGTPLPRASLSFSSSLSPSLRRRLLSLALSFETRVSVPVTLPRSKFFALPSVPFILSWTGRCRGSCLFVARGGWKGGRSNGEGRKGRGGEKGGVGQMSVEEEGKSGLTVWIRFYWCRFRTCGFCFCTGEY